MNCCVFVPDMEGDEGVTAIDTSAGTVTVAEPWTPPSVAVIVLVPAEEPLTDPAEVIVAVAPETGAVAHVTKPVRSCVLALE